MALSGKMAETISGFHPFFGAMYYQSNVGIDGEWQ